MTPYKLAQVWSLKTAKDLPADVERYVQEGKDSGMDEGKAWAVAWSRYCKYKNPGSDHCKKDPSEYFEGRKAGMMHIYHGRFASGEAEMSRTVQARLAQLAQSFPAGSSDRKILQKLASEPHVAARKRTPSGDIGECPPELRDKALQSFKKGMEPVAKETAKALEASGFKVKDQGFVLDEYDSEGVVLYYFESKDRGDFYLRFSGEPEVVGVDKWEQVDVDDTEEWQEEVLCPPSKHQEVAAYNADTGKELILKGRVTPNFIEEALKKVGLSR